MRVVPVHYPSNLAAFLDQAAISPLALRAGLAAHVPLGANSSYLQHSTHNIGQFGTFFVEEDLEEDEQRETASKYCRFDDVRLIFVVNQINGGCFQNSIVYVLLHIFGKNIFVDEESDIQ